MDAVLDDRQRLRGAGAACRRGTLRPRRPRPRLECYLLDHAALHRLAGRARPVAERTTQPSVMAVGLDPFRDHEGDGPLVEGLVVRIDEFDHDLMRAGAPPF